MGESLAASQASVQTVAPLVGAGASSPSRGPSAELAALRAAYIRPHSAQLGTVVPALSAPVELSSESLSTWSGSTRGTDVPVPPAPLERRHTFDSRPTSLAIASDAKPGQVSRAMVAGAAAPPSSRLQKLQQLGI